jgi:putative oxidoreductase
MLVAGGPPAVRNKLIPISMKSTLRRAAEAGLKITGSLAFLAPLLTRLMIGWAFHQTGHGKLLNLGRTASFFADSGIPFPRANAAFIGSLEFVGGLCLILGLGTRIVALLLSATMVVALMTADRDNLIQHFAHELTDVVPVVYGIFLLWLIVYGPGPISIDYWIRKKLGIPEESDNREKVPYAK